MGRLGEMRILTPLAKPGLELAKPSISPDGKPLFGRGTRLARRHLRLLHEEGVRVLEVKSDVRVESWERIPDVDEFIRGLEDRFSTVEGDRRMDALKQAVQNVYLDFLFELDC